jgi:hypothetical protein
MLRSLEKYRRYSQKTASVQLGTGRQGEIDKGNKKYTQLQDSCLFELIQSN